MASDEGIVIAASMWGKVKTTVQMIMIITLTVNLDIPFINVIEMILVYASLALTLISLADYLIKNKNVVTNKKSAR